MGKKSIFKKTKKSNVQITSLPKLSKNSKKENNALIVKTLQSHTIYIVVYKTATSEFSKWPTELTNGILFEANSMQHALAQFADWANSQRLTTFDIYAVELNKIVSDFINEVRGNQK